MKNLLRYVCITLLAVVAMLAVSGLVACGGEAEIKSLSVENAKIEFMLGDEFELGDGFTVYAHYSDGSKVDVTESAEIRQESGFNMNVAGDYQITVGYDGKYYVYTVYVGDFENILRKLELDTTAVKKTYSLGDDISFDGLKIICTHENAQGKLVQSTTSSLKEFDLEIKSATGIVINETFASNETYTVTISQGNVKASYSVTVDGINISSVESAIKVGKIFQSDVVTGTQVVKGSYHGSEDLFDDFDYAYEYGNNYTHIAEKHNSPKNEYHFSVDDEGIFCVNLKDGQLATNAAIQSGMMEGPSTLLWYLGETEFGIENALKNLYGEAKTCSNKDLKDTVDEDKREYSFAFSGLKLRGNKYDYYETSVSFKLGESYNVEYAQVKQDYYENNIDYAGMDDYTPSFITDEATGITRPNQSFSYRTVIAANQTVGERTAVNPYSRDMFKIKSYKLKYDGKDLGDNGVIDCNMQSPKLVISISDIAPETASLTMDALTLNYEGSHIGDVDGSTVLNFEGLTAYVSGNKLNVTLKNGGVWKLILKTENTAKTLTFDVVGVNPTTIEARVGNELAGSFYDANKKIIALGGVVHFYGEVDVYANAAQSAEITSESTEHASIQKVEWNGVECFEFSASQNGEYEVTVTSDANSSLKVVFTFTVSDIPDYAVLLKGGYKTTDQLGNIYSLVFTPEGQDQISGKVAVTKTPTEEDGTPITSQETSETLSFSVDTENFTITLTHVSGETLGVDLSVNEKGELMLEDQYGRRYKLVAA